MADWYYSAEPVDTVSLDDRGFQYGDGLFETIAVREGEPRLWTLHIDRLHKGCAAMNITLPSVHELTTGLEHAISASKRSDKDSIVKLIVTAGTGKRGYGRLKADADIYFGVFEPAPLPRAAYRDGIATTLCNTRLGSQSPTAGLKTLSRTEQVLARSEFAGSREFEGFTMDTEDHLICGTMSNVFFVRGKSVSTPPVTSNGVAGVMRRHLMACLETEGRPVTVSTTLGSDLVLLDEVFISNSQLGVVPVRRCGNTRWAVGDITREIMVVMADNGIAECRV